MKAKAKNDIIYNDNEINVYKCLTKFREPLLKTIIKSLNIPSVSNGLDAGCGIGSITKLLSYTIGEKVHIIGLDLSKEFVQYAKKNNQRTNLQFTEGDINSLHFNDNSFDWVWSLDTVWPGPKEFGCPAENPLNIINEFYRVIKPGGFVYLLLWSSQKLLTGYPLLEAQLNTTSTATVPFIKGMDPLNHIMNARYWLHKANFKNTSVKTYTGDIIAPLNNNDRNALSILFQMLWGGSESEVSGSDWKDFVNLSDQYSDKYILNNLQYYGFYTYTLFQGKK